MKKLALSIATATSLLAASATAAPADRPTPHRAATAKAPRGLRLAGRWHGFPVWSLAVGAVLLSAGIAAAVFNTDPTDDLPDSN